VPVKAYDIKKTSSTISGNMLMATEATENGKRAGLGDLEFGRIA